MNDTNGNGGKRYSVLAVLEKPDREDDTKTYTRWMKVGVAFPNRDGSMNLYLDAFPVGTNKLQVREDRDEARPAAGAAPRKNGFETMEVRP
jgi:hypothetical protein